MKRSLSDPLINSSKRSKSSLSPYFLPINTGLTYCSILGYRVIVGNKEYSPEIKDFNSQKEAEVYLHNCPLIYDYCLVRALVSQEGFYLEDQEGGVIDINTGKKYQFVNKHRVSEWDLNKLDYKPIFKMI